MKTTLRAAYKKLKTTYIRFRIEGKPWMTTHFHEIDEEGDWTLSHPDNYCDCIDSLPARLESFGLDGRAGGGLPGAVPGPLHQGAAGDPLQVDAPGGVSVQGEVHALFMIPWYTVIPWRSIGPG